jgi:hypothetical protein
MLCRHKKNQKKIITSAWEQWHQGSTLFLFNYVFTSLIVQIMQGVLGEVDFWIFNFLQFAIDGQNNSKTKVENVFFFIFMSSCAEMSFSKKRTRFCRDFPKKSCFWL